MSWLILALGGAMGTLLRHALSQGMASWWGRGFPHGTLLVNTLGALAIGLLRSVPAQRLPGGPAWRDALCIGLLGGFTTFSAFSWETVTLFAEGARGRALLNVLANVTLCLVACALGMSLGRRI